MAGSTRPVVDRGEGGGGSNLLTAASNVSRAIAGFNTAIAQIEAAIASIETKRAAAITAIDSEREIAIGRIVATEVEAINAVKAAASAGGSLPGADSPTLYVPPGQTYVDE